MIKLELIIQEFVFHTSGDNVKELCVNKHSDYEIKLFLQYITHGNAPVSVSQLFRTNNEYHNYNTRNCAHIIVPVGTTEASYRTFGYRGIYIWNHISQKININTSYPCFKNLVKIYIQNNNLDNIRLNY